MLSEGSPYLCAGALVGSRRLRAVVLTLCLAWWSGPAAAQTAPPPLSLSEYFTTASPGPVSPDSDGFIRRWLILEPIVKPNSTNIVFTGSYVRDALSRETYPGNFDAVPHPGEKVGSPEPLVWHALDSKLWDVKLFNFA